MVLLVLALWLARPALPYSLYRGFVQGRASGALLFSIMQAFGEQVAQQHYPSS